MMTWTGSFIVAAIMLVLGFALPARGAYDAFLKIEGIDGESADHQYKDWMEIESFSFGVSNTGSFDGGGGAGKAVFLDLKSGKILDKATPKLMLACASGQHLPEAVLILRKAGGDEPLEFFEVRLTDVLVSSSMLDARVDQDRPGESLSLHYGKIEWIYTPQEPDGTAGESVQAGWDLIANTAIR